MSSNSDTAQIPYERPVIIRDEDATNPIAISFEHVTKTYKLFKNDRARFKATLSKKVPYKEINASDDLSFTIARGEAVAFLGNNGAGKSTALKIITGVTYPTHGKVEVHGRVSALLELSAGFDSQLSGRENIKFRGQLWGISDEQMAELEPGIIEFAELGDYIDQPLRTYSSGMKARLGFAFASSIKPDILVVDEALSVGDRKFSKKCQQCVHEIMSDRHVSVLFVTHSSSAAKEFCSRGIVLEHGKDIFEGSIKDAIAFYENRN
ncbi:Teichoic acids export ATP-binding protein TagH [Slackia heliotrinireducens]|uniref:ABC-type polysaccharide/polyol phosphate transport system, ATPase component n=1 Tax=Slackia heliotrinireducens (strain ATCC 29202 / DSM 20476 / NCTC 11029 / RHS 1) TaxID=471855 RepID=C7N6F3_SLAHD|nr:ABC transporter ATP-binding protein [Slackia heliotrinireducens]ACV22488.1 ABC-type polysaccharide/polyol phosphate transport system, ATPase component [Slackia heliotrinireducens DSM 20476]VEH00892.1 Teichoic acids export ATP-binding protein TagH [Slackia heliotrinireducens]